MKRTKMQWRRDVFASDDKNLTAAVKLLLLFLADHMKADNTVSLPREVIAEALGIHQQRVAERLQKAVQAQFLVHVRRGRPGRTAEYQACWPDELRTALQDSFGVPLYRTHAPHETGGVRTALLDAKGKELPTERPRWPAEPDDQRRSEDDPWSLVDEDPYLAEVAE